MAYVTEEARQDLLDAVADAITELGVALAALGAAYELVDEQRADALEEALFRPVQLAYGRAQKAASGFAERHGLPARTFTPGEASGPPSQGVRGYLEQSLESIEQADHVLAELQDSMLPVEVGDQELRAGLADVRERVGGLVARGEQTLSLLGR